MHHEMECLETTYFTIKSENLPENFDGVQFVLLSDLHNKSFGEQNVRLLLAIEKIHPEFIVIAGDMITFQGEKDNQTAKNLVRELGKKYDVFYGPGNHETKLSEIDQGKYKQEIENTKVHYLDNQSVLLRRGKQEIRITGLNLPLNYFKKFRQTLLDKMVVEELLGKKKDQKFTLLIAHKPAHFKQYIDWGADLVVSGHVHGGIIQVPFLGGVISPQLEIFPKYDAGKFILGKSTMIISKGLGSHSIPIRINNRPEIVVITMKK